MKDYTVKIGGKQVTVHASRMSVAAHRGIDRFVQYGMLTVKNWQPVTIEVTCLGKCTQQEMKQP